MARSDRLGPPLRSRLLLPVAIAVVCVFVFYGPSAFAGLNPADTGSAMLHGKLPYRDFPFEYPPGGALLLAIPALAGTTYYRVAFRALMAIAWLILCIVLHKRSDERLSGFLLCSIVFAFVIDTMFDIFVALAVTLAFFAHRRSNAKASAGWISSATALKLVPVVLMPLVARGGGRKSWMRVAIFTLASLVFLVLLPRAVARNDGDPLAFQSARKLHAESSLGSAIVVTRLARDLPSGVVFEHRSQGVTGGHWAKWWSVVGLVLTLSFLLLRAPPSSPATWMAVLLAVPAIGPIASPQFFVWPLGLSGMVGRTPRILYLATGVLSFVYFMVPSVREAGQLFPASVLLARNATAIAATAFTVREALKHSAG